MKRGLEARVSGLEQAIGAHDRKPPIIVVSFISGSGELVGYLCWPYGKDRLEINRKPGESEEELKNRAVREAKLAGLELNGVISLHDLRR